MSIGSALLPLLALLAGGAVVVALVLYVSRRRSNRETQAREAGKGLPTDPIAYLFVDKPEE